MALVAQNQQCLGGEDISNLAERKIKASETQVKFQHSDCLGTHLEVNLLLFLQCGFAGGNLYSSSRSTRFPLQ